MRAASWVGWPSERARVRSLKSALLSLSVTVEPASALDFSRADTRSVRSHSCCSSGRNSPMSRSKVVSAEMLLVSLSALTLRSSSHRADPVDEADRLGRQEFRSFRKPEHGEAARLVHIGAYLGEEFVGGQPDRDRD